MNPFLCVCSRSLRAGAARCLLSVAAVILSLSAADAQTADEDFEQDEYTQTDVYAETVNNDYDGDGRSDPAVFRTNFPAGTGGTSFLVLPSSGRNLAAAPNPAGWQALPGSGYYKQWGLNGDIPVPGGYSGSGATDFAVFRPQFGIWFFAFSYGGTFSLQWGLPDDCLAPASYSNDSDNRWDMAFYRASNSKYYVRRSDIGVTIETFASTLPDYTVSVLPCPLTYNSGVAYRVIYIKHFVNNQAYVSWRLINDSNIYYSTPAQHTDVVMAGNYDGLANDDYVRFRPSTQEWFVRGFYGASLPVKQWGLPGDIPVSGDYDGDGTTDYAVWRPSHGTWYVVPSSGACPPNMSPLVLGHPESGCYVQWGLNGDKPLGYPLNQGY